ncbi:MAG TPA: hypothetical protein VG889_01705 [Rhizomicrobium sp.]|nr:hypothetical protein [Rhizomicrobium sp.]
MMIAETLIGGVVRRRLSELWDFATRVYVEFSNDRIPTVAGGITFFTLLALSRDLGSLGRLLTSRAAISATSKRHRCNS